MSSNISNVGFLLTLVLAVLLAVEAYFVYSLLYANLTVTDENIATTNIVRVDLKAYQNTVDLLDESESFEPLPLFLPRPNPFK